ncbi:TonB-dependent Receptor Plug domain protein [Sphingomonas sp. EC-HK361]|uniref:TonB-dependent receptor n=1 Tax=Sphingomonas sp. EC-HK361 TaxID=2038397 RepID=UPI001252A4EB|nr:TonB-dependent receptor [Sphingomonas sp. EC-HK361]VVS96637.1 TonB-dependent Receptor Plug domain protein [Sphingomonas sp. EC-HK361]
MRRLVVMFGMMTAAPAWAQQAPAPATPPAAQPAPEPAAAGDEDEAADIVVTGSRQNLPGAVVGDIPPEVQLGPADIRSYGVSSVSDLLDELGPQTQSGVGGPPVVLLNGRRIAGFSEIRDIPTEAILRVDILPEEVALKYGYRADQKVVNFVLRRRFRAVTIEAADKIPTEGGSNTAQGEFDLLHIARDSRVQLHTSYTDTSALTEAERNVIQEPGSAIDLGPYRTLTPGSHQLNVNMVYARPFGNSVNATINGSITQTGSLGTFGLPIVTLQSPVSDTTDLTPLSQRNSSLTSHLGATVNGTADQWRWTTTAAYDRVNSKTLTDTSLDLATYQAALLAGDPLTGPFGLPNRGNSVSSTADLTTTASGPLFALPAGDVSTTIKIGADTSDFTSDSFRSGLVQSGKVSRDTASGQINVDVPIASRSKDVLAWAGNFSLNGNFGVDRLSDFGTLVAYGYGFNWSVIDGVRFIGSVAHREEAPSAAQLGNPQVLTPNTRVFDYVTGQTVNVTTLSGGNPLLRSDTKNVQKLGLTLKPWAKSDLTIVGTYVRTTVDDPIASFPTPTAAIEAAFGDRFTRVNGTLVRLDTRPINYARTENSQFRYGFNFSKSLKSKVQREIEAYRAGTGPNPFAGMTFPGRQRRQGGGEGQDGARGNTAATSAPDGAASPPADSAARPNGPQAGPGGRRGFSGGGRGFGGRGGGGAGGGGRLQFAVYHTIHLTDRVDVLDGGPSLDLLRGDAIGQSGGQPRHEVEGQAGYTNNGIGARLSANWQSGTTVQAGTAANPQTLDFSSLATFNLRLFADLGGRLEWVKAHPWMRGTRVTLSFNNLTNQRQRVTDANGLTPISYQPAYLDALGRSVRISVRKLFF